MYANMKLGRLIDWLKEQDPKLTVKYGFGGPHSDRGSYDELAFEPVDEATFGDMLKYAELANGSTFTGWKGGLYTMDRSTSVYIGDFGECGYEITPTHFKYWLLTAEEEE